MKINDNVSLIIPTFNRDAQLRELLEYLNKHAKGSKLIVADSSSDMMKENNKKAISQMKNLNIEYLDHYKESTNPNDKFYDMIDHSKEYTVFHEDDDFMSPIGVNKSYEFLKKHPDYSSARGYIVKYQIRPEYVWWHETYLKNIVKSDDPVERVIRQLENYSHTFFSLHRTEEFSTNINETRQFEFLNSFTEVLTTLLDFTYGNVKVIPAFYCAREKSVTYKYRLKNNYTPIQKTIENGTFKDHYPIFKAALLKHLNMVCDVDEDKFSNSLDRSMRKYLSNYIVKTEAHNFSNTDLKELDNIFKHVANGLPYIEHVWSKEKGYFMETREI